MGDVLLNCLFLTLLLLGLAHAIVFGLGRIPKGEGNHERGRSHDSESHPVQNMGREFAVEGFEGHDATLSRPAGVTEGRLAGILRGEVTDLGGGKVEIAALEGLQDGGVSDVGSGGDALPLDIELSVNHLEVLRRERVVDQRNVQGSAIAHIVQTVFHRQVLVFDKVHVHYVLDGENSGASIDLTRGQDKASRQRQTGHKSRKIHRGLIDCF